MVSEWQWHQLGHMQVCTMLQTDNHASTPPLVFYRPDALPAAQPTASKHWRQSALKAVSSRSQCAVYWFTCLSVWFFVHILCCVWYTENMTACCHLPSIKIHVYNFLSTIALASVLCKQRLKSLLTCHNTLPLQQNHRFFHMYVCMYVIFIRRNKHTSKQTQKAVRMATVQSSKTKKLLHLTKCM